MSLTSWEFLSSNIRVEVEDANRGTNRTGWDGDLDAPLRVVSAVSAASNEGQGYVLQQFSAQSSLHVRVFKASGKGCASPSIQSNATI
ncbi:hypothetical protein VTI28DRAFT_9645 [Corynascus sepedonium]